MESLEHNRRPLKTRSAPWAQRLAAALASTAVSPNQISVASIGFAVVGVILLSSSPAPWSLLACAACIQLRLLCNLLDGMVALEGGKKSVLGAVYNEVPDRVADSLFIIAVGYAVSLPWLGWCSALLAALTAYIRVLGGALGLPQDFRGPMAKPHRMAVLTIGCLLGAAEMARYGSQHSLLWAEWIVGLGSLITCGTRLRAMAQALHAQAAHVA